MRNNENNIILHVRNITLYLENIKHYLTEKPKIITLSLIIIMLSFVNIINVSALSYSSNIGIGFTFNPTLSISLSSSDLVINDLVPGSTLDSNVINVSVATNASYGYTLFATVGDNNHNNSNLTHSNNTNIFSSIATNADLSSLDNSEDDNIWGYSYKDNTVQTPTWSNYNGLSSIVPKTLLDTNTNNTETGIDSIDFKIGAKAASTQASGTYTGIINFTAVSNVAPMSLLDSFIASGAEQLNGYFKMQDMTHSICSNVDIEESELQLIDVRDNKIYWVAKLKDGNCWMTQNLDLAGGIKLYTETSDVPSNYPTGQDYYYQLPTSSPSGGFNSDTEAYVYNVPYENQNRTICTDNLPCYSYYSWLAATVGGKNTDGNIPGYDSNAAYSICPKNWKLPTSGNKKPYANYNDFYKLAISYNMSLDILSESTSNFYDSAGPNTTPNLIFSGYYRYNSSYSTGSQGYYWSSTAENTTAAWSLAFSSSSVNTSAPNYRRNGFAIRCLAR